MLTKEILLKAAELLDEDSSHQRIGYSCVAITTARNRLSTSWEEEQRAQYHFSEMFSPYYDKRGMPFWSARLTYHNNQLRVLCLLFAAWSYEP